MKKFFKQSIVIASTTAASLLFSSCDDDSESQSNQQPNVLSSFQLLVNTNNTGVGQPVGASLLLIERNDGLLLKGELHNLLVLEESNSRVRFQYSGGPLANGVIGIFDADINAKTWSLIETPAGVNRDMSGSLNVLDLGQGHSH